MSLELAQLVRAHFVSPISGVQVPVGGVAHQGGGQVRVLGGPHIIERCHCWWPKKPLACMDIWAMCPATSMTLRSGSRFSSRVTVASSAIAAWWAAG
jgi:hypothetical protein